MTRDWVVAHNGEADILVDHCKQLAHILLEVFERVPDVHLRDIFTVGGGVLELESLSLARGGIVNDAVAIAVAIGVGQTFSTTSRVFEGEGLLGVVSNDAAEGGWDPIDRQGSGEILQDDHGRILTEVSTWTDESWELQQLWYTMHQHLQPWSRS